LSQDFLLERRSGEDATRGNPEIREAFIFAAQGDTLA
jgi:hypothetical protein